MRWRSASIILDNSMVDPDTLAWFCTHVGWRTWEKQAGCSTDRCRQDFSRVTITFDDKIADGSFPAGDELLYSVVKTLPC